MKVHELLDSPTKWTKGHLVKYEPGTLQPARYCLLGALDACCTTGTEFVLAKAKLKAELGLPLRSEKQLDSLALWNDVPERTFEEVRALCLKLDI